MLGKSRGRTGAVLARRSFSILAVLAGCMVVLLFGCRDELATTLDTNLAPDTYLTGVPAESTATFYRVHLYWYGNDEDGRVVGYEYAVTDSFPADEDTITYHYTTKTDSVFLFPVGASEQILGHRFYIRAIDNAGVQDPEPAWAFFGAIDLIPPLPVFTIAEAYDPDTGESVALTSTHESEPSDTVNAGWDVRFEWTGIDADRMIDANGDTVTVGQILQYEYWLLPIQNTPILVSPEDTVAVYDDLSSGKYKFSLRAVDDAGFMGLDPTVRTFVWNKDPQTYFARALNPATSDSAVYFEVDWTGLEAPLTFFEGDTIPLVWSRPGGSVRKVNLTMGLRGHDPDDLDGSGVRGFQYRLGVGQWKSDVDTTDNILEINRLSTTNSYIQARCTDGQGRRDGSPAGLGVYINRAPNLLQNVAADGEPELLMHPFPDDVIRYDDIAAWGDSILIRVRAADPDSSTNKFHYSFRIEGGCGSALYTNRNDDSVREYRELKMEWPTACGPSGDFAIGVRIEEDARSDGGTRLSFRSIPFTVTD